MPNFQVSTTTATLVASTAYTAIELRTSSSTPIKIIKWWCDFNSSTSTDKPLLAAAARFTAAVTTASAATPMALSFVGSDSTASTSASVNTTVEGAGAISGMPESHYVAAQAGLWAAWETDDSALWVATSSFWRLRITPGSAITSTTANCGVVWVE
ncbi:hypothetical protein [Streptacidiphilus rugosus]|uniref:hypothetical protein n=1 Tax=Streptacidiphilus rugosus TaxID=405783 RepID=UPI000566E80A|nr:hypothetical protein [Streptacidiphilus rugosus]